MVEHLSTYLCKLSYVLHDFAFLDHNFPFFLWGKGVGVTCIGTTYIYVLHKCSSLRWYLRNDILHGGLPKYSWHFLALLHCVNGASVVARGSVVSLVSRKLLYGSRPNFVGGSTSTISPGHFFLLSHFVLLNKLLSQRLVQYNWRCYQKPYTWLETPRLAGVVLQGVMKSLQQPQIALVDMFGVM